MKRWLWMATAGICALALLVFVVEPLARILILPNTRFFVVGDVELRGPLRWGMAKYRVITIGSEATHYDGTLGLVLRSGPITVNVDSVDTFWLQQAASRQSDPNQGGATWPPDAVEYVVGDVRLVVSGSLVVRVATFGSSSENTVHIGSARSGSLVPLPLLMNVGGEGGLTPSETELCWEVVAHEYRCLGRPQPVSDSLTNVVGALRRDC